LTLAEKASQTAMINDKMAIMRTNQILPIDNTNLAYLAWLHNANMEYAEEPSLVHLPFGYKVWSAEPLPKHEQKILAGCEILAKAWGDVYILPNANGVSGIKSPDIFVAGKFFDIKVTNSINEDTIRDHISKAAKQCGNVLFLCTAEEIYNEFLIVARRKTERKGDSIREVWVIRPDSELIWVKK